MTEQPMRRTQARLAERERQRKKTERKQMLLKFVPLGLVAIFIVVGVGTLIYNNIQATGDIAGHQGPRLSLDRDQIDFGDLKLDNTVRASFKVANVGDGTLHLTVPNVATVVEGC